MYLRSWQTRKRRSLWPWFLAVVVAIASGWFLYSKQRDILEAIAPDEDLSQIDDSVNFRDQLELDSMDFLDIVMELRKRHRIQIPEDDYVQLASMDSTVAFLEPLMKDIQRV